jgi:RHS repeat-associated protein
VILSSAAGFPGVTVNVSSDNLSATVPASVTVAQGATSRSFTVTTTAVVTLTNVTITASAAGITKTVQLAVYPPGAGLVSVSLNPTSVTGGSPLTGTVGTKLAPVGFVVYLSSDSASAVVPTSVTVTYAQDFSTQSFTVTTTPVTSVTNATITATASGVAKSAVLTINPAAAALSSVSLDPPSVTGGSPSTGTVTLTRAAGANGFVVNLSSNDASATVPSYLVIAQGAMTGTFTVTTTEVPSVTTATITASAAGVIQTAPLTVNPSGGTLQGISLDPVSVIGGSPSTGTVTLSGPAPTEGALVALSSNDTAVTVPASVTVPKDQTSVTFAVTTSTVATTHSATITAVYGYTRTATLTVNPAPPVTLIGVAPGWVLAGDTTPVLYGTSFADNSTVVLMGPVYTLTDFVVPICTIDVNCPTQSLAALASAGGTRLAFGIPFLTAPGIYLLRARSSEGVLSTSNSWIGVDNTQRTRTTVAPDQHHLAQRIYPGQTVTGTLTGTNPLYTLADYNYYYFVATAGSYVNVSMQRVDTSLPWDNPSSLDPRLEIIAPDGFIYKNLTSEDNWPGVDRDASITNAILPKTGLYFIAAETTRGSGDYRLSFNLNSLAPPPLGARAVPVVGNFNTVVVNAGVAMKTSALLLDPRGYPVGGAAYSFNVVSNPGDTGAVQFIGGNSGTTSLDGFASANVKFTAKGRVRFKPSLDEPAFQQSMAPGFGSAAALTGAAGQGEPSDAGADDVTAVPRYVPVARRSVRIVAIRNGEVALAPGDLVRLPEEAVPGTRLERDGPSRRQSTGNARSSHGSPESTRSFAERFRRRVLGTTTEASARVPLGARTPLVITSCDADLDTFFEEGIDGASMSPTFTMTLTDETPSTGQTAPNGVVDADGIHGHRIEKVIRLRIDIKDAMGQTPAYPVLVRFGVGGPRPGKLILDPDGNRIECDTGSFIWHERDAQGNLVAPNEEVEYRLGTYALFRGAIPDAPSPFGLKPLWGVGELLSFEIGTVDASGAETSDTTSSFQFDVHPEPGKPDHFSCIEASGSPCPDLLAYWSDFYKIPSGTKANGDPRFANSGIVLYNSYFLHDRYDNVNFGYTSTSATQPQPNIAVEFKDQTGTIFDASTDSTDFAAYSTWVHWNDDPSMPQGRYTATLSVTFPADPEWSGGTVTKNVDLQFDRGTYHALVPVPGYEARFGVDDGGTPFRMAPGATTAGMPKTSTGDVQRLVLLGVTGSQVIGSWPLRVEPWEDPHKIWKHNPDGPGWVVDRLESPQDPRLETSDAPRFRLSLRDEDGNVVKSGAFRVHRCPRFDHEGPPEQSGPSGQAGRPCDTVAVPPLDSFEGVVDPVTLNPSSSSNNRGYLGIELLKAPTKPGFYFIHAEASSGETPRYRIPIVNPQGDQPEVAYSGGELLCLVENEPDPRAVCCSCQDGHIAESPCTASPTFVATGTYESHATDLELPTAGLPLAVSRQYFSSRRQSGFNGVGWSSSLEAHLSYAATSLGDVLDVLMPTGVVFRFTFTNPNGPFTPPQGRKDTLVKNADKSFNLTLQQSRIVYHFDEKGRLTAMTDEYGSSVTIGYGADGKPTQIADASGSGRFITVSYRGDGKIDHLQDSAGRTVRYEYDPDGTLTSVRDPAGRLTNFTYSQGSFGPLLTRISDNWDRALTAITYDVADRTKSYSENFETYSYSYIDSTHTQKKDSSGNTTTLTFGAATGLIADHTPPQAEGSAPNHKDFDSDGHVTRAVDETGVATSFTYDSQGHVTSVTRDSQGSTAVRYVYTYDASLVDKVTAVTPKNPSSGAIDPNWQGWKYDYFPLGSSTPGALRSVLRVKDNGSTEKVSGFTYDSKGRILQQTSAGNAPTDYAYDSQGNLSTVTAPLNSDSGSRPQTVYSNYDGAGRPQTIRDPLGKITTYTYDSLGRVLTVTLPPANGNTFTTTYSYDNFDSGTGLVFTHITDPNNKLTKLGYDEHGRLVKSVDAANNTTTYAYTNDLLTSITDANGNPTGYHYDVLKRLDKTTFPDTSTERYTYYADGLLQTKTDRNGQMIGYEYDAFKRLKKKTYPNGTSITYNYTGQKLTSVVDTSVTPNETHSFGYDSSYRVSSNTQATRGTLGYTYTADDRVDKLTIAGTPDVIASHTYYADGSLKTISWSPQAGAFTYTYTANGQYQTVTFPNGQHRDYGYDDQGRLVQIANIGPASQNLATYAYGYDASNGSGGTMLGQRTSMTANVPSQGLSNAQTRYSYDPLYQLKKAEYPAAPPFNADVHQWTYDDIGNRLTNQVNAATQTYGYEHIASNPKNGQKLLNDGVNAYTYDFNGNQVARAGDPGSFAFGYDPDNRLTSITGSEFATYTYDYQGRRTSKVAVGGATTYLYDGLNLVRESVATANTDYVFGPSIDEPLASYRAGTLSYIDVDGLGSTVAENDPSGAPQHSSIFDVWGVARTETGSRFSAFGYTGREFGEAGLWFYRARWYQPTTGRFGAEDPMRFEAGLHFYDYLSANPLSGRDPLGLFDFADTSRETTEKLEAISSLTNGFADNITFGLMRAVQRRLGNDNQIDYCSTAYDVGQWTGVAWSTAFGGALGVRAAGVKGAGNEFSHWIPDRILKQGPSWARKGFGRSALNGNYVTPYRHYLQDPFRYPGGWRSFGPRLNPLLRQLDRLPRSPLGTGVGLGAGLTSREEQACGCQ